MKVEICRDERYPDYCIFRRENGDEVQLTEEEWAEGQNIERAYNEWQNKLEALYRVINGP